MDDPYHVLRRRRLNCCIGLYLEIVKTILVFQHDSIIRWRDTIKIRPNTTHADSGLTESINIFFEELIDCHGLFQREVSNYPF